MLQRLVLLSLLAGLGFGSQAAAALHPIIMIGDSHTAGAVSGAPAPGFAALLEQRLGSQYLILNAGVGGASSRQWNPAIPCSDTFLFASCIGSGAWYDQRVGFLTKTEFQAPMLATVMLGTNDATGFFLPHNQPTAPIDFLQNIVSLTERLLADGVSTVLLLSPPPLPATHTAEEAAPARILSYRSLIQDYCESTPGVSCEPDVFTLIDPASDFFDSNIHINAAGHAKLADALRESILAIPEAPLLSLLGGGLAALVILRRLSLTGRGPTRPKRQATPCSMPSSARSPAGLPPTA